MTDCTNATLGTSQSQARSVGGLGRGDDAALDLAVGQFDPGPIGLVADPQRVVEHHPAAPEHSRKHRLLGSVSVRCGTGNASAYPDCKADLLTTQTYRRARHSVSLLHAHLVFVTKYRRAVFTDAMLTFCEHTMRGVCAELDVELVEFNGEADHVHLLVAYPPTLAISILVQRLKGRTAYACAANSPAPVSCPHARTPLVAVLLRRLLRRCPTVDHQAVHRRTSPTA